MLYSYDILIKFFWSEVKWNGVRMSGTAGSSLQCLVQRGVLCYVWYSREFFAMSGTAGSSSQFLVHWGVLCNVWYSREFFAMSGTAGSFLQCLVQRGVLRNVWHNGEFFAMSGTAGLFLCCSHIPSYSKFSVVELKWFIPDLDPALNFPSSGSLSRQKFQIHANPDPTYIN